MGKESKAKEIGKYNVCITLILMVMHPTPDTVQGLVTESINCRSWNHIGNYLALDLYDGTMRVICLNQYHGFTITPIDEEDMKKLETRN